ncbi:MAG TPA: hypothetical protein VM513_07535 [Kofleriaceae bacterium]|jgi:hypothetical protein|nr:hypothetical protein [Kofleriaceae bacterium]
MTKIVELCGFVMTGALLFGCVTEDATGEVEQLTAGSGAVATTLSNVTFGDGEFQVKWNGFISKVKGPTNVISQQIVVAPGGHTGWHTHPGPVFVSVATGAMSVYYATSPCSGATYPAGTGFLDPGGTNTHIARNLSDVPATLNVQYIVPTGSAPRIDQPAPAGADSCP